MEHDIDIEEHDVLDNPRIKDIFPDLSIVKTEIINEDDVTLEEYNPYLQIKQEKDDNEDHQDFHAAHEETSNLINPIVSNAGANVPNTRKSHDQAVLPCERFDTDYTVNVCIDNEISICEATQQLAMDNAAAVHNLSVIKESGGNCSNSLVVANKKKTVSTNPLLKTLLQSNSCVPQHNKLKSLKHYNQIFAGRTNKYNIHGDSCDIIPNKIILGSKIVPETPEVQEKQYLPTTVVLKDCGSLLKASLCYCVSCKILFPTENSLDSHKMSAHSFLVAFSEREADISIESENDSDISHFSGRASVSHSNSIKSIDTNDKETNRCIKKRKISDGVAESIRLASNSTNFGNTISGEQCFHCDKFFTDYSALIKHMYDEVLAKRSKVTGNSASNSVEQFQCQICNESFSNNIVAKFHARFMHPNQSGNFIRTCAAKSEKNGDVVSKANIHTAKVGKFENNKTNTLKMDKADLIKKQNLEFKYMLGVIVKNPPIPISVLFKCSKCDLHLVTAQGAFNHSTLCYNSKTLIECKKCKRKFKPRDLEMHELQHVVSKSFKAYVFQSNLTKRFLCRCPKCNICFNERLFWKHLLSPCIKKFIHCKKCNLNINRETYMNTGHVRCEDHVVIDYYDDVEKPTVRSISDRECVGDKNGRTYRLWFCEKCKMCGRIDLGSHNCNISKKCLCKYCGLYFSRKRIETHIRLHSEETLNLHNFLLFSLKKRQFVQPPMPHYKYCKSCKMYYLRWHTHCIKNYKICDICSKKFEKEHYELHKQFHTYNLDEIVNVTIRNGGYVGFKSSVYIFQCVQCKCFIYDYDQAVRHAQNHISGKPQEIKYCEKCNKTFESTSLDIHILHKHSLRKLKILNFDSEKIHSDAWFDLFDGLDQVEEGNILMDSVYKDTRSLDLTFIQKGDSDKTLYVCSSCNIIVEKTVLEKHVSNKMYCWENRKYKCDTCDLYFYSPGTMEAHKKLHSNGVKKEDFCIILVNNVNAASLEAAELEKHTVSRPLETYSKLVLQRKTCGKKDIWMKRELADTSRIHLNSTVSKGNDQSESEASNSSEQDDDNIKKVSLFKCMDCKACIFSSKYTKRHFCSPSFIRFCDNCKQFFYKTKWRKHNHVIHSDMKKINFKLNNFRIKTNKTGKRQAYIGKVTNILYDKTKLMEIERPNKIISHDEDFQSVPLEENYSESDDIKIVSQPNARGLMLKKILNNNIIKDIILYKCTNCKTCIIRKKSIGCHWCTIEFYRRFCNYCQQWFSVMNWERHKAIHTKERVNILIKYFKPTKIFYAKRTIKKQLTLKIDNDNETEKSEIMSESYEKNQSVASHDDIQHDTATKEKMSSVNKADEVKLFKCINCNVCILAERNQKRHKCSRDIEEHFCRICNQGFSKTSFNAHKNSFCQGKKNNLKIIHFTPTTLKHSKVKASMAMKINNQNEKSEYMSEIYQRALNAASEISDDVQEDRSIKEEISSVSKSNEIKLFKCTNCKVCILTERNQKRHKCSRGAERHFCRNCNQGFSKTSFNAHRNSFCQGNKNDLKIIYFTPPTILKHSKVKASVAMKVDNRNEKREYMSKIYQRAQNAANGISHDIQEDRSAKEQKSIVNKSDVITLFKCTNCKVCILAEKNENRHKCSRATEHNFCSICNQGFSAKSYYAHKKIFCHGNKKHLKIIYFTPSILKHSRANASMALKAGNTNEINGHTSESYERTQNAASDVFSDDVQQYRGTKEKITSISKSGEIKLFKCTNCKVCILNINHQTLHRCNRVTKLRFCGICKQDFSITSFYVHKKTFCHGNKNNLKIVYFTPGILLHSKETGLVPLKIDNDNKNEKSEYMSAVYKRAQKSASDDVSDDVPQVRGIKQKMASDNKSSEIKLFKCTNCKVCILNRKNQTQHKCNRVTRLRICHICKQGFSVTSFQIHKKTFCHGNKSNLKIIYFTPSALKYSKSKQAISKAKNTKFMPNIKSISECTNNTNVNTRRVLKSDNDEGSLIKNLHETSAKKTIVAKNDVEMYRCVHCQTCTRKANMSRHRCLIDIYKEFCNICKEFFPVENFARHKRWHSLHKNINLIVKNFEPLKVNYSLKFKHYNNVKNPLVASNENTRKDNSSDEETYEPDVEDESSEPGPVANLVVSKCDNCNTCIFSKDLDSHICSSDIYKKFCRLCQQTFTSNNWNTHNRYHKEYDKLNLIIKDFQPKTVKYGRRMKNIESLSLEMNETNAEVASVSEVFDEDTSESLKRNTSKNKFKKSYSDDEDYKPRAKRAKVYQKDKTNLDNPLDIIYNEKYNIYVCAQCDVHFVNKRSRQNHSDERNHVIGKYGFGYCRYCKLRFSTTSAKKHQPRCPLKYKSGYINVFDIENNTMRTLKHDGTELDLAVNLVTSPSDDESTDNKVDTLNVDNCEDTNLTNNSHVSNTTNNTVCITENSLSSIAETLKESLEYSSQNNLADNNAELSKILNMTQDVNTETNTNSYNDDILDVINDLQSLNATHVKETDNNTVMEIINLESRNMNKKCDENSVRSNSKKIINTDSIVVKHNIIESDLNDVHESESTRDTVNEESNAESNSTVMPYETKLYTCSVCEVYFLKAECCQAHITNHTKLDAREYIQCKLCLLQFLVMDLHIHIITHHSDGFKFEEVVIEDFTPDEVQPRIYKLRDKLQSLIISTTCTEGD